MQTKQYFDRMPLSWSFFIHIFYVLWQVLYNTDKSLMFMIQQNNKSGETNVNTFTTVLIKMYFTITCN